MYHLPPTFGFEIIKQHTTIEYRWWNAFITDAIKELMARHVKHNHTPPPNRTIEEYIALFNYTAEVNNVIDGIIDELDEFIQGVVNKHGGYSELVMATNPGSITLSIAGDHRILEWYRGRGKEEPEGWFQDENMRAAFDEALAVSFNHPKLDAEVTIKPEPPKPPSSEDELNVLNNHDIVYITKHTAFVDGSNMDNYRSGGCELVGVQPTTSVYEVNEVYGPSKRLIVGGNWSGYGDTYRYLELGDQFCMFTSSITGRVVLELL